MKDWIESGGSKAIKGMLGLWRRKLDSWDSEVREQESGQNHQKRHFRHTPPADSQESRLSDTNSTRESRNPGLFLLGTPEQAGLNPTN